MHSEAEPALMYGTLPPYGDALWRLACYLHLSTSRLMGRERCWVALLRVRLQG